MHSNLRRLTNHLLLMAIAATCIAVTSAHAVVFPVSSTATYLRPDRTDSPASSTAIALAPLGITPGMIIDIRVLGDWNNGPNGDQFSPMEVVFSSSSTLLGRSERFRVPGAIGVGRKWITPATCPSSDSLDITEDFDIDSDSTIVVVPVGASYLFAATADCFWMDNSDPDGDLKIQITVLGTAGVMPGAAGVAMSAAPNPFVRTTVVRYSIAHEGPLQLAVYDVTGRQQRVLASGPHAAGTYTVAWDGRDAAGRRLARGSYFVRMTGAAGVRTLRVVRVE